MNSKLLFWWATFVAVMCQLLTSRALCQTCVEAPSGIVAWWRAETNANDALGSYDGIDINGVAYTTGKVGQAFSFSGANRIEVTNSGAFSYTANEPMSFELWAFQTSGGGTQHILGKRPGCSGSELSYQLVLIGNTLYWGSALGSVGVADALPPNLWTHVVGTFDGANYILFVNGELVGSAAGSMGPENSAPLTLGTSGTCSGFLGLLDEVTFYSRALDTNEVATLYAADAAGKCADKPIFTTTTLPDAITHQSYSQTLSAILGVGPYSFELVSGTLPTGLALASNGLISGTPEVAATNDLTFRVTDSLGATNEHTFTFRVLDCADVPAGIIAWWRAETNALDSVGTNHGTLQNGLGFSTGYVGQAFDFDGADDYVLAPDTGLPLGSAPRTLEFWMKPQFNARVPVIYGDFAAGNAFFFLVQDDKARIGDWNNAGGEVSGSTVVTDGEWHHAALTYDGATARLYIDGVLDAEKAKTYDTTSRGTIYLGSTVEGSGEYFHGELDEVTIYNRALSSNEIAAIYIVNRAGKCTDKPVFLTSSLPDGGVGSPYSQQIEAGLTPAPYTFELISGNLPLGLEMLADGAIEGTPVSGLTNDLTIRVTDGNAMSSEWTYTLAVADCVDVTNGLVAWWRGQDDALDAAGINHGTLSNGVAFAAGLVGQALIFDGVDDFVAIADAPELRLTNALTIEFWAQRERLNAVDVVLAKGNWSANDINYGVAFHDNSQTNAFYTYFGGGNIRFVEGVHDLDWHHYAVVVQQGDVDPTMYIDGIVRPISSRIGSSPIDLNPTTLPLILGKSSEPTVYYGKLKLDEVALYSRALSSNEVAAIFAAGSGGKCGALYLLSTSPLPGAGQDADYLEMLVVTNGTDPHSFAVIEGTLPVGLDLSTNGILCGIPTSYGSNRFTVRVTDAESRPADRKFSLVVNARPMLPTQTDVEIDELTTLMATNTASDPDEPGQTLTYELIEPPAGAIISSEGVITWPTTEVDGPSTNVFTTVVTDDGKPSLSQTNLFTVTVNEVNLAPALTVPADTTIDEQVAYSANATATDDDLPANTLTFELISGPSGLTVSPGGAVDWTPDESRGPNSYPVTVRVFDDGTPGLSDTNTFTLTVNEVNLPPALTVPADTAIDEQVAYSANAPAMDADLPANTLTFELISGPSGLTVSPGGAIDWTPDESQRPNSYPVTVRVFDDGAPGLSDTNTFTLTVNEVNLAPAITVPADTTIDEQVAYSADATATDDDLPANTLTFELVSGPSGLTVSPSGAVDWTPDESQGPNSYPVAVRVFDNGTPSLSQTLSFTLTVSEVNLAPSLGSLDDYIVNPGQTISFGASATDDDLPANNLSFSLINPPSGAAISSAGLFDWRPSVTQADTTNSVIVRVADDASPAGADTNSFVVVVNPLLPTVLTPVTYTNGEFRMNITGTIGPDYIIQASSAFGGWTDLGTNTPSVMPFSVVDTNASSYSNRLYRALTWP